VGSDVENLACAPLAVPEESGDRPPAGSSAART
jgi:hypothetical protein